MLNADHLFFNHASSKDEGIVDLTPVISTVDAIARINNQSCFIVDFDEHKLLYRTEKLVYIDECSIRDIQRECANPYWSIISEETLEKLLDIRNNYHPIGQHMGSDEYSRHVCTIDYPVIIRSNQLFINQRFSPLKMRSDGITKVGLFMINHSSKTEMESTIITPTGKRFRFDFAEHRYIPYDLGMTLSVVERAILNRARQGMGNEDIARSLCISVNTVKTHRKNIFRKLQVESITEALTVVGNYQLI